MGRCEIVGSYNTLRDLNVIDTSYGHGIFFERGATHNLVDDFLVSNCREAGVWFDLDSLHSEGHAYTSYNTVLKRRGHALLQRWVQPRGRRTAGHGQHDRRGKHPRPVPEYPERLRRRRDEVCGGRPHGKELPHLQPVAPFRGRSHGWHPDVQLEQNLIIENNIIGSWAFGGQQDINFPNDGGTTDPNACLQMQDWFDNSPYQTVVVRHQEQPVPRRAVTGQPSTVASRAT